MLALAIEAQTVKTFMNRLLKDTMFDEFEVRAAEIVALTKVEVSGAIEQDTKDLAHASTRTFAPWPLLKPLVYAIVKHGQKPRSMKVVFSCKPETNSLVHPNASALFLNLIYENDSVTFTTATAQKQFVMEHSLDTAWEAYVTAFFQRNDIRVKPLS